MGARKTLMLFALVLICGCSKSPRNSSATQQPITFEPLENVAAFTKTNLPRMELAMTNALPPQLTPKVTNLVNWVQTNVISSLTNSAAHEGYAALKFLVELKDKNELPGVSKDDQMDITGSMPVSPSSAATYPFSMIFHLVLAGDSSTNHYGVVRMTANGAWQIERAWRTDSQGRVVNEWPVK